MDHQPGKLHGSGTLLSVGSCFFTGWNREKGWHEEHIVKLFGPPLRRKQGLLPGLFKILETSSR